MRGDRPAFSIALSSTSSFTPHARGSTLPRDELPNNSTVYPACAGIDPDLFNNPLGILRLPRMRGDRPFLFDFVKNPFLFTPHARGSTS